MFSDIAGYTAIMARDEQEGLDARNSHRELLHSFLPRFNGRLLSDLGDGALSSFHSAIDAVSCARAFQAAIGTEPRFRIRVGIHIGDVLFADNTVLGDGVNIASRIQALAPPGGICISERVYEEIRNKPEFQVKDLGEQQLKNVPRPIRVYVLAALGASAIGSSCPRRPAPRQQQTNPIGCDRRRRGGCGPHLPRGNAEALGNKSSVSGPRRSSLDPIDRGATARQLLGRSEAGLFR